MKYMVLMVAGVAWGLAAPGCQGSSGVGSEVGAGGVNGNGNRSGQGSGGGSGSAGAGGAPASPDGGVALSCSDLFDPGVLQTYSIDISADVWNLLNTEFNDLQAVLAGTPDNPYHPITLHYGNETVSNAWVRLKGQSSWVDTVTFDQPHPKMQFVLAVDQIDSKATFHGVGKIVLDMPRTDWTFMNERLANAWFRQIGILAPCANSAKLYINGAYYGLYVSEEDKGQRLVDEFFPGNSHGDLIKGGQEAETNKATVNWQRLQQFRAANNIGAVESIVDVPSSVLEWAAEAVLNDGDGYYGGSHNFLIYDQGQSGYTWLPTDVDSTIEYMAIFSKLPYQQHPIFWWEGQPLPQPPGQHYLIVMNDPPSRARYTDAIATQLQRWNIAQMQGWITDWSQQIADAVDADPNKWATSDDFRMAVAAASDVVVKRPAFLQSFVDCEHGAGGADQDGDGYKWCDDCRDDDPSVHPGATEICGNGIDDNCNGLVDEGCPSTGGGGAPDAGAGGD